MVHAMVAKSFPYMVPENGVFGKFKTEFAEKTTFRAQRDNFRFAHHPEVGFSCTSSTEAVLLEGQFLHISFVYLYLRIY